MQPIIYIILIAGALAVTTFLYYRDSKGSAIATVLKTIASLFFIVLGVVSLFSNIQATEAISFSQLAPALLIIMGLVFGLVGDVTLDLKIAYPKDDAVYTYAGMTAFGIGHILYLVAMSTLFPLEAHGWSVGYSYLIGLGAAVFVIAGAITTMGAGFGKYLLPSFLYASLLIGFTVNCIVSLVLCGFSAGLLILLIGSVFFLISDMILTMTYFIGKNSRAMIISNHVTYYIAQFLIAISLAFLVL